ncbi:MAG: hypothetical protein ACP5M0_08785 [Desulfomonilaceae bacterium]
MASLFADFSHTYQRFVETFPKHPLAEELKNHIMKGKFPSENWLRANIKKMNDLMTPPWMDRPSQDSQDECA